MDLGLKGAKVLVTGSTKGIGRAIAETFAAEGANVGICARNQADVDSTVAALKAMGVAAFGGRVDVSDGAALKAWVSDMASKLGGVDAIVSNVSALAIGQENRVAGRWRAPYPTRAPRDPGVTVDVKLEAPSPSTVAAASVIKDAAGKQIGDLTLDGAKAGKLNITRPGDTAALAFTLQCKDVADATPATI